MLDIFNHFVPKAHLDRPASLNFGPTRRRRLPTIASLPMNNVEAD